MNKTTEALKLADKVISRYRNETPIGNQPHMICHIADEALAAIREVLADPVQEPVACHERQWVDLPVACDCGDVYPADSFGAGFIAATGRCQNCDVAASVSAKREWVDLTEGEQEAIYLKCNTPSEYTNAVIAAFKDKNK